MAMCGRKHKGSRCTLEKIEGVEGGHYGPGHIDQDTDTGWFDDTLPEPPPPVFPWEPPPPTDPDTVSM